MVEEQGQEQVYMPQPDLFMGMGQHKKGDDFSRWQLEGRETISIIYNTLMGLVEIENEEGKVVWVKSGEEPVFSHSGALEICSTLRPIIDRNIFLSNLSEKRINSFMRKTLITLVKRLGADAERYGLVINGQSDPTKVSKARIAVEAALYAALCRSAKWKTLDSVNESHEIREIRTDDKNRGGLFGMRRGGE